MTAMEEQPKKKSAKKRTLKDEGFAVTADAPEVLLPPIHTTLEKMQLIDEVDPSALHVVKEPKPKPKPGEKDFDWQAEYPGEEVFVYTVPEGTKSPAGLTVGLAKITEDRAPNPGRMRRAQREGGFSPMWLFIESVSSPASLAVQDELRPPEYNDMLRGWAEFAGIELSE